MRKVLYILGQLDDADVEWLATNGQRQKLAKGSVVIQNGVRSENLYIVIDGRLAMVGTPYHNVCPANFFNALTLNLKA